MQQQKKLSALDQFHSYISQLDYYKDLDENKQSIKRNLEKDQLIQQFKLERQQSIESVPLKFTSDSYYVELWKKLFLYEAKAQILKAKLDQATQPERVEITKSQYFQPFRYFTFKRIQSSKVNYNNGNLVIISPDNPKKQNVDHILGFIEGNQELVVKLVFNLNANQNIKFSERQHEKEKLEKQRIRWEKLQSTKDWYIQNLCGIVTLQREFKALCNFSKISFKDVILNPFEFLNITQEKFQIPKQLNSKLKEIYNETQYKAIHECLKLSGITLVQGPPGTGKTKTVLGTLSVLLNSFIKHDQQETITVSNQQNPYSAQKENRWLHTNFYEWRDQCFLELPFDLVHYPSTKYYCKSPQTDKQVIMKKKNDSIVLPGKILICGPSNASVDEIIRKILSEKLLDAKGNSYLPSIIRIGDNFDNSLQNISLDYLVNLEMSKKGQKQDVSFYRSKLLREAKLVCGTLSAAGHQFLESSNLCFDTVVIDQACQAVEVSTLIPLIYGCKRLILIGDPNQLPSTIFSRRCIRQYYDQSLFERMMKCGYKVNVLKTQYRMHPSISKVIGNTFYNGLLQNYTNILQSLGEYPLHTIMQPFIFFHVNKSSQITYKNSFRNINQAKAIKLIVEFLLKNHCNDIGILSPYSQQISYLQSQGYPKQVQIKTIDSFQGRQKNVIIFNTVRAALMGEPGKQKHNSKKTIGFLSDKRRVNVGLSRAKYLCIIVGDANRLNEFDIWNQIIHHALQNGAVYQINSNKDYFKGFVERKQQFSKTKLDRK